MHPRLAGPTKAVPCRLLRVADVGQGLAFGHAAELLPPILRRGVPHAGALQSKDTVMVRWVDDYRSLVDFFSVAIVCSPDRFFKEDFLKDDEQ